MDPIVLAILAEQARRGLYPREGWSVYETYAGGVAVAVELTVSAKDGGGTELAGHGLTANAVYSVSVDLGTEVDRGVAFLFTRETTAPAAAKFDRCAKFSKGTTFTIRTGPEDEGLRVWFCPIGTVTAGTTKVRATITPWTADARI